MELVSIVVPVYNAEKYIDRCVQSLTEQTYPEIEIILVDDGSPDASGKLCDVWSEKDTRIKVIHKENGGASSARNAGIEVATGSYISFVDADDYVENTYIEVLMTDLVKNGSQLSAGSFYRIDFFEKVNCLNNKVVYELNSQGEEVACEINYNHILRVPWGKLFVLDIINKYGLRFDQAVHYGEDTIFVLQYLRHCTRISLITDLIYNYNRVLENSLSGKFSIEMYQYRYKFFKNYIATLKTLNLSKSVFDQYVAVVAMGILRAMLLYYTEKLVNKKDIIPIANECYKTYVPYFLENMEEYAECEFTAQATRKWYMKYRKFILNGDMEGYVRQTALYNKSRVFNIKFRYYVKKNLLKLKKLLGE